MSELKTILTDLSGLFDELILIENEKLDAAVNYKVVVLEECMKKEQAAILRLRGLDQKREAVQAANGWEGCSFREMIERVSEEAAEELRPAFRELETKIALFSSVNDDTNAAIRTNLHFVDSVVNANGAYPAQGQLTEEIKHFTNRKA